MRFLHYKRKVNRDWTKQILKIVLLVVLCCALAGATVAAPKIIKYAPSADTNYSQVSIYVMTNESSLCRVSENNVTYPAMEMNMTGNGTEHWLNQSMEDSYYEFYASCINSENESSPPFLINFTVDTTPPLIIGSGPSGSISSDYTILFVSTNERAKCEYEASGWKNLESSDGFNHQVVISGLSQGPKTYRIICSDQLGNTREHLINFYVRSPVYAQISLSKEPPLKAGLYEVMLTASTELMPTPTLTYKIDENVKSVDLIGSGRTWKGYLIIEEGTGNKIGSFSFKGTDYYGTSGDLITSGKLFIIDTVPPNAPILNALSQKDGSIRLNIRFEGENLSGFRIYRSSSSGVSYLDYYNNTTEFYYVDRNAAEGKTYYYAVSAVDLAGNEGALSNVASAVAVKTDVDSELSPQTLNSIGEAISAAESAKLEIEHRIQNLKARSSEIVSNTGILEDAQNAMIRVESAISNLRQLRNSTSSDEEIMSEVSKQKIAVKSALNSVPVSIELENYPEVGVSPSGEDIASAISKAQPQNAGNIEYLSRVQKAQERIKQSVSGALLTINYEGSTEYMTLITQKITLNTEENNSMLISIIPKSIAEDSSQIKFLSAGYTIIQSDPVVSFPAQGRESELRYIVKNRVSEAELGGIKAVLLERYSANVGPTGYSVFEAVRSGSKYIGILVGVIILAALAVYYFRGGKDSIVDEDFEVDKGLLEEENRDELEDLEEEDIDSVLNELRSIDTNELSKEEVDELRRRIMRLEEIKRQMVLQNRSEGMSEYSQEKPDENFGEKNKSETARILRLYDGSSIKSIQDLKKELARMDSDTFNYHVNFERNDFADWIKDALGDRALAARVRKARSKKEILEALKWAGR